MLGGEGLEIGLIGAGESVILYHKRVQLKSGVDVKNKKGNV